MRILDTYHNIQIHKTHTHTRTQLKRQQLSAHINSAKVPATITHCVHYEVETLGRLAHRSYQLVTALANTKVTVIIQVVSNHHVVCRFAHLCY